MTGRVKKKSILSFYYNKIDLMFNTFKELTSKETVLKKNLIDKNFLNKKN